MNTCAAMGSFGKVILEPGDTPRTFDASSERIDIVAETMQRTQAFQGRRRITGDLSQYSGAVRPHSYLASGAIVLQVGAAQINQFMPRVLWGGNTASAGASTYTVGTAADSHKFDLLIDRENGIFRYTDCQIARCVIRSSTEMGQSGQNEELVEMILYIMAIEEEINGTTWPASEPALVLDGASLPYAHWEGVFTLNSHATPFRNFELTIDNRLQPIWYSSLTPNCFRSAGRVVTLKTENPFTATTLADAEAMLSDGVAAQLLFTHSDDSFTTNFQFAHLRNNYKTPTIRGKGEIPLELSLEAFRTASTGEIVVVNDFTPTA